MIKIKSGILLTFILLMGIFQGAWSQSGSIVKGKIISDSNEELIAVTVSEVDKNNRVVGSISSDLNGEFSLKIKDEKNKLRISYVGFRTAELPIGSRRIFNVSLVESTTLQEVVIKTKKRVSTGGMDLPAKEVPYAVQKISAAAFEGLQVSSIDDALQGQIAGLDVVGSGNVGQGSSMRIRGTSSINGNTQPLIVINGIPRENEYDTENFEFGTASEQQYAELLSVNPDDIEEIQVLKDAASTAIWGARGANGVIMIQLKKGIVGPTRVTYKYMLKGSVQPKGIKMLSGENYTQLMKEAYFNPQQKPSSKPEFDYLPESQFADSRYYSVNTDWRDEVIRTGITHDHFLSISGGGERARFRVTGGFVNAGGTIVGQNWKRTTSNMTLDYNVSNRIMFSSEFAFSYQDNQQNWEDDGSILDLAYKKMPNLAVYDKDGNFYTINESTSKLDDSQKKMKNPVALANLAQNNLKSYKINPTLRLQYDLLDPDQQLLRLKSYVSFNLDNSTRHKFLPKVLKHQSLWAETANRSEDQDNENFSISSESNLQWETKFPKDHHLSVFGSVRFHSGSSNNQKIISYGNPSSDITDASAGGVLKETTSGIGQSRYMQMIGNVHYSYQSKYIFHATMTREGSTLFGKGRKFGNFPGVSLRWNIVDEPFMGFSKNWLSMLSIRPSWGITGNSPGKEYMHFSRYSSNSNYGGLPTIKPDNIRLTDLRWEKITGTNIGMDLGFLDDKYTLDINYYHNQTKDMLFSDPAIPGSTGYDKLPYRNGGTMNNDGWEVYFNATRFVKAGNFSMDMTLNVANSRNSLVALDQNILNSFNGNLLEPSLDRSAGYYGHIQPGHSYGSIYGFRYKGVYKWSLESYLKRSEVGDDVDNHGGTIPVARDAGGTIIRDGNGVPVPMYFDEKGAHYQFQGGDAIYEDVNHDGNIDALDIVYLGNSNPKLNGGFTFTFRYKQLSLKTFFNYRYGQKVVNQARRNAESMSSDNNQSIAVNWRWRQEGDERQIPRALHDWGYNYMPSDRFVEDASFLRFKYLIFNYSVPAASLKKYGLNRMNLYVSFDNILYFTKYQGLDPEVGMGGLSAKGISTDNLATPRSRELIFGVSVEF